jgi:dephospho-CoA kinase
VAIQVFGLTGGIASGKSTVARRFASRGLPVIDADLLARRAVEPGTPALAAILEAFGPTIVDAAGHLDRKRLGAVVFADAADRLRLNAIIHPRVRDLFAESVRELDERGEPLACYEVPLLFEVGLEDTLRPVVVVSAPESTQLSRLMARDGRDEASARERLAAQLPLGEKVTRADYVIDNGGTLAETYAQADRVLDAVARSAGVSPERYRRVP